MQSPEKHPGWTGDVPVTERKRRGRNVDVMGGLPTPPRTRQTQLPTPETGRRTEKRASKLAESSTGPKTSTTLPTPETLPRKRKPSSHSTQTSEPPSPSGHTTFFLSSNVASSSRSDGTLRRRPGLTFAQQMGLLSTSGQPSCTSRSGAGVGMGGARPISHKVDQIFPGKLAEPLLVEDDNPFVVSTSSAALLTPGRSTKHLPVDESASSPQSKHRAPALRSPPMLIADPVHSYVSLLSPPPTQRATRIRTTPPPPSPTTRARQVRERQRQHKIQEMRDEDDNPFLVKPGQKAVHRPGAVVDENRPTVTYVFRGAKKVFANPFIDSSIPVYGSNLDPEDEEFEPHPCPKPKLLWPTAPAAEPQSTPRRNARGTESHSGLVSDSDASPPSSPIATPAGQETDTKFVSDDEFLPELEQEHAEREELPVHRGLLFGAGAMKRERDEVISMPPSVSKRSRQRL